MALKTRPPILGEYRVVREFDEYEEFGQWKYFVQCFTEPGDWRAGEPACWVAITDRTPDRLEALQQMSALIEERSTEVPSIQVVFVERVL